MHQNKLFCILILLMLTISSCTLKETRPPPVVQPPVQTPLKPAKIALVLGAGSSKGFAHVGVLKILGANKIPIHMVVGTSAGSIVGSLFAYGFDPFQLQKLSISVEKADVIDLAIPEIA